MDRGLQAQGLLKLPSPDRSSLLVMMEQCTEFLNVNSLSDVQLLNKSNNSNCSGSSFNSRNLSRDK